MNLMIELRHYFLKQKLVKPARRFQKPSRSSSSDLVMRRVKQKMIEQERIRKESGKMVRAINQIRKARKLKKEINTIIKTHFHKKQVVLEIQTRSRTVKNKDRMIDELNSYIVQIKKERAERKFSFKKHFSQLYEGLRERFLHKANTHEEHLRREKHKTLEWIRDMPVSKQIMLKKGVNQEIRQLRLKYLVQRELVTRFNTVDLKEKLCKEILSNARTRVIAREQRPFRSKQMQKLTKQNQRLESIPENACVLKDIGEAMYIDKFSKEVRQREKQKFLKERLLQELRIVKRKMEICREINLIGAVARNHKAVVQNVQALGDKARVMQQIENKDHWLLNPKHSVKQKIIAENKLNETKEVGIESTKEVMQDFEPFAWGAVEERQVMLKSLVNQAVKSLFLQKTVNKMLSIRSKAIKLKSKLLFELKVHFAKTKCMYEIRQLALARRNHKLVIMELKQRISFAKCARDIKKGSYNLNHVSWPIEISSVVMLKQQIRLRGVNTVIQQAGLKARLNQEIANHQWLCNRKARAIRETVARFGSTPISTEARPQAQTTEANYNHVVQELEQRCRHREVVKEIKTRQKQIFWKMQTCIIIRQGGHKIRVNKEIRSIARQKYLKKQINTIIKTGGLKSRVQREIRQLRKIAALRRQRDLKSKVNTVIREMAKARQRIVAKQTSLKPEFNSEIRRVKNQPISHVLTPSGEQRRMSQDPFEGDIRTSTWLGDSEDESDQLISDETIAVMKLVESVTRVSETSEKQDKIIRKLTEEITQQRRDFVDLNKRVVDDKKKLYRKLEELMRENEQLSETFMRQTKEEKLKKSSQEAQINDKNYQVHRQHQQTPMLYQEMQELISSKFSSEGKLLNYQHGLCKQREAIPESLHLL